MHLTQNLNVLLCTFLFGTLPNDSYGDNLKHYLSDRFDFINTALQDHNISTRSTKDGIEVIDEQNVIINIKNPITFTSRGEMYLLVDQEIYRFIPKDNVIEQTALSKLSQFEETVAFIKTVQYNTTDLMFVGYKNGLSKIYRYFNDTKSYYAIHSIQNANKLTDAKFFFNNGSLYLIVSSMLGVSLAPITVYKWMDTHFDQIKQDLIQGSIQLETFKDGKSEIIIVLINNGVEKSISYVYEFKADELRKIQILENSSPRKIITFPHEDKTYVIVTDERDKSILYLWKDSELVPMFHFVNPRGVEKIIPLSILDHTLIFMLYKDKLSIHTIQLNELKLLTTYTFRKNLNSVMNAIVLQNEYDEPDTVLIFGLNNDSKLTISRIMFIVNEMPIVGEVQVSNELIECMDELEETLVDSTDEMEIVEARAKKIIKTNEPLEYHGRLNVAAPVLAQFAEVENTPDEEVNMIIDDIKDTEQRIIKLISIINNLLDENTTVIQDKVVILGSLNTFHLKSQRTQAKVVNGIIWNQREWLSYSSNQVISKPLRIKELVVQDLTQTYNGIFNDMFIKVGNQKITAPVTLNFLKSPNIYTQIINGILVHKIYLRSQPSTVKGIKIFNNVQAKYIQMELLNEKNASQTIKLFGDPKGIKYEFLPSIKITNLNVENINNVNWEKFSSSVFRIGSSQKIEGNIKFTILRTNILETKSLSGIDVDKLLTKSTDQSVNTSISFGVVNTNDITCKTINGLDLEKDVARFGDDANTLIKGPVTVKEGRVRGDLNMTGTADKQNQIVGPNEADLFQNYNNKVKITGNLHLRNIYLPHSAKLFVSGNEFNQGNFDEYWLKTTNQDIPTHFEAQMGITTPHLSTKFLNSIPIGDYMVNNLDDKMPTSYVFENATIAGNVIINEKRTHTPDLEKLDKDAIKANGTYVIKGAKYFSGKLSVDHLRTDQINSIPVSNFHTVYSKQISGVNKFKTLTIEGDVSTLSFSSKTINGLDLDELYNRTLFIDEPIEFESIDFVQATAENLFVTKINNKLFSEYQLSLSKIQLFDTLNLVKIRGSAKVNNLNVNYINDISIRDKIKREGDADRQNGGKVIFEGKVRVKNLFVSNMNEIDFTRLFPRLLNRDLPQNITARYTFKVVTARNLMSPRINDIDIFNLIDTKSENKQLLNVTRLRIMRPIFSKSLFTDTLVCNVANVFRSLHVMPVHVWKSVVISGDAAFLNIKSSIGNLLLNAVRSDRENVITAPLTLNHVYAEEIIANRLINGADIKAIYDDALLVNGNEQVVTGFKTFNELKTLNANVQGSILIPIINHLDIVRINNSIIPKSEINKIVIKGRKTFFEGLEADQILTPLAAGVLPENLVSLTNLQKIPNATFDTLMVEGSLNVSFVNGQNFDEFMNNRLLLHSPEDQVVSAVYFFDEIELIGPLTVTSINEIAVDEIVFDEGVQVITAPKKFNVDVDIIGDVIMEIVNGFQIDELYNNAIMLGEEANIQANVRLNEVSEITGNIIADKINDIPMDLLKDQLQTQNAQIRANIVRDTIKDIEALIEESVAIIQRLPDQYLYLEKSDKLHVEVQNSVDADVVQIKENLMVHVKTEEAGEYCGLPAGCTCPNQFTFVVSPGYSVNRIDNKYGQRVFSYQDRDVTIHIVANSWSSSGNCRTNVSTLYEFTTLTWKAQSGIHINQTTFTEKITGYISDVQFFPYERQVYAVICRFYDPILNSHNLECMVVQFSKTKGTIEIIQRIPTHGAWKLHIFYTAQGVNLVIGNRDTNPSYKRKVTTDVYRFYPEVSMFKLLRRIPSSGCLSITSLVLGYDSLIVLAQVHSPMQTLKYNHVHDNYYFYQNMLQKYPVVSVSAFYTGGAGISDAYLTAVGDNGGFHVFSYQFLSGWKLESEGRLEGLRKLVPFTFNRSPYMFAASVNASRVLTIVKHGFN